MTRTSPYKLVCPSCGSEDLCMTDGWAISLVVYRRRRMCNVCETRWSTVEMAIDYLLPAIDAAGVRNKKKFWEALGIKRAPKTVAKA